MCWHAAGRARALVALLCVIVCGAAREGRAGGRGSDRDYGSMYDDQLLQEKQAGYREVVLWNLNQVFLPKLTVEERRRLQGLDVQFPLRGPERQLFEYFATTPAKVVLPVMSIRFLADLSVAYAWLQSQGYTLETVTDYVSMLKYQPPARFGGRYPDPRAALQIPPNAVDDPRVDLISGKILNESLSFILLHEVGHILYRHPGYGPGVPRERARENEDQADRFALEVLRRVGQPIDGLLFWFLSAAHFVPHRADFGSDAEYQAHLRSDTHPLTSERMRRLSEYLRTHAGDYGRLQANPARAAEVIRGTAAAIDAEVVPVLADPDQQRLMAMKGQRDGVAQARDDLAMRRHHGGRGLARPHDREDAGQAGAHAKNPSRTEPARRSPMRDGNSRCRSWCPGENQMERSGPPAATAAASARRLAPLRTGSPESASIRSAGAFKAAQRVEGRCSQSDRRIAR
jgi:hypothetical protein